MRLVCPSCASQYEVDESLFPEEGREVQCSSCEEVWVQYPVKPEPPMRLDPLASVAAAVPETPERARPSERLDEDERSALAAAVKTETELRDKAAAPAASRQAAPRPAEDDIDDEAIIAALRAQIEAEGGDFGSGDGGAKSQKRNLKFAAEAAGIDVVAKEDDSGRRKWDLDEKKYEEAAKNRRDGLSQALKAYEKEAKAARAGRRGGLRRGITTGLALVVLLGGIVAVQDMIIEAYPPAAPVFEQVNALILSARTQAEALYVQYAGGGGSQVAGQ